MNNTSNSNSANQFKKLLSNKLNAAFFSRSDLYNGFKLATRQTPPLLTFSTNESQLPQTPLEMKIIKQIGLKPLSHTSRNSSFQDIHNFSADKCQRQVHKQNNHHLLFSEESNSKSQNSFQILRNLKNSKQRQYIYPSIPFDTRPDSNFSSPSFRPTSPDHMQQTNQTVESSSQRQPRESRSQFKFNNANSQFQSYEESSVVQEGKRGNTESKHNQEQESEQSYVKYSDATSNKQQQSFMQRQNSISMLVQLPVQNKILNISKFDNAAKPQLSALSPEKDQLNSRKNQSHLKLRMPTDSLERNQFDSYLDCIGFNYQVSLVEQGNGKRTISIKNRYSSSPQKITKVPDQGILSDSSFQSQQLQKSSLAQQSSSLASVNVITEDTLPPLNTSNREIPLGLLKQKKQKEGKSSLINKIFASPKASITSPRENLQAAMNQKTPQISQKRLFSINPSASPMGVGVFSDFENNSRKQISTLKNLNSPTQKTSILIPNIKRRGESETKIFLQSKKKQMTNENDKSSDIINEEIELNNNQEEEQEMKTGMSVPTIKILDQQSSNRNNKPEQKKEKVKMSLSQMIEHEFKREELELVVISLISNIGELKTLYNSDLQLLNTIKKLSGFNDLIKSILLISDHHAAELRTPLSVNTAKLGILDYLYTNSILQKPGNSSQQQSSMKDVQSLSCASQIDLDNLFTDISFPIVEDLFKKIVYFSRNIYTLVQQKRGDHQRKKADEIKSEINHIAVKTQQQLQLIEQQVPPKPQNMQEMVLVKKNIDHILDRKNYMKQQPLIEEFEETEEGLGYFKKVNEQNRVQSKYLNELNDILRDFHKYA